MPEPTLFDAINTAIETDGDDVGGPRLETDDSDAGENTGADDAGALEAGDDQDAGGSAEGDDQGGEPRGENAEGDQPDGEGGKDAAAKGQTRNADGTYGPKAGEKPGDKPGDKGAKKPDYVNDPIPKDLKQETQDRMRFLVGETKKLDGELKTVRENFDFMVNGIKATGTTPEQYGEILSFMGLFNSGDRTQQEQALEILEGMADRLATSLGKERSAADPLAAHPDLKEAVAKGQITPALAKQLAISKNREKFNADISTAHAATQRQAAEHAAAVETARVDMNALEDTLAASDPQFAAIKAQIVPVLKPLFSTLPPGQWKTKFMEAYRNAKANFRPAARPSNPKNQPMRGGRTATGGGGNADGSMSSGGPADLLAAVNAGIAAASRR